MKNKRFNTVEEVQSWGQFTHQASIYDLSHLDAHKVVYTAKDRRYEFIVTYSFHVFAKVTEGMNSEQHDELMFHARKESRPFNFNRYFLSLKLPEIIERLADSKTLCFHAARGSFATCKVLDSEGNEINYIVLFKAFREKKKLRLHITTAYPAEPPGRVKKINFIAIAKNTLLGNKVGVPK
jgi:hypothetical protein